MVAASPICLHLRADVTEICEGGGGILWNNDVGADMCTEFVPILAELICCSSGCMGSTWTLGGPSKTFIYSGTLVDQSCDPFYQYWRDCHYDGTPECTGVLFDVIISEAACP